MTTCHDCGSTIDADEARDWGGLCPGCWWLWKSNTNRIMIVFEAMAEAAAGHWDGVDADEWLRKERED